MASAQGAVAGCVGGEIQQRHRWLSRRRCVRIAAGTVVAAYQRLLSNRWWCCLYPLPHERRAASASAAERVAVLYPHPSPCAAGCICVHCLTSGGAASRRPLDRGCSSGTARDQAGLRGQPGFLEPGKACRAFFGGNAHRHVTLSLEHAGRSFRFRCLDAVLRAAGRMPGRGLRQARASLLRPVVPAFTRIPAATGARLPALVVVAICANLRARFPPAVRRSSCDSFTCNLLC